MSEELKALEHIKGLWVEVLNDQDKLVKETVGDLPSTKIIEKSLKVWEIVEKKDVDVGLVKRYANASQYNCAKGKCNKYLDQEEFDLIKGVLKYATL